MERRRDYRLGLKYEMTLTGQRDRRVRRDLVTSDVSATGLSFACEGEHGLTVGDRLEVRLLAQSEGRSEERESMVLSVQATMVRAANGEGAVVFDGPLQYA
jgi:hypothetical protein